MIVLGIETSCDETAAAVVADGNRILASIVHSQEAVHHPYGGVVPELAARSHLTAIVPTVRRALEAAGIGPDRIDGIAVTQGPGLVGALLVGFSFAKAYAHGRGLPWVGVNHLAGHIESARLADDPPDYPFVALLASGGHTSLYHVTGPGEATPLGHTRDDAAGEAFDKVAKLLGLGYPGGRVISELAGRGDPDRIRFPRSYLDRDRFDFSFSGVKTAVRRHVASRPEPPDEAARADIAAGFQEAVVDVLRDKVIQAARTTGCERITLVGGVAANARLRERVGAAAEAAGIALHLPPLSLCGDNAAMIAAAGTHDLERGIVGGLDDDVYSRGSVPPASGPAR